MTKEEDEKAQKEADEKAKADAEDKEKADAAKKAGAEDEKSAFIKKTEEAAGELRKQNEEKTKLLEREEKLQDRKEALVALGGESPAGTSSEKKEETPKEYNARIEKEISEGKHDD